MTFVGKILVFVITGFALIFMGFAVTLYTTKKNWKEAYDKEVTNVKKGEADRDALKKQIDTLTGKLTAEVDAHKKERDLYVDQLKIQEKDYTDLLNRHTTSREDLEKATSALKNTTENERDRRVEAERLREDLKATQAEKEKAVRKQFETDQAHIVLLGQHETMQTRLKEMTERANTLKAVLESYGFPTESKEDIEKAKQNPPQVEGIVKKVDREGKYVEISVGSDAGLRRGHRLEVYRVKPQGKYVGRIELTEVDPDRAVARILTQFKQGTIQEGDIVAPESLLRGRQAAK